MRRGGRVHCALLCLCIGLVFGLTSCGSGLPPADDEDKRYGHVPGWNAAEWSETSDTQPKHQDKDNNSEGNTPTGEPNEESVSDNQKPSLTPSVLPSITPTIPPKASEETVSFTTSEGKHTLSIEPCNDKIYVSIISLNLRSAPTKESNLYRKSYQNEIFTRTGTVENGWFRIIVEGTVCYVYGPYTAKYNEGMVLPKALTATPTATPTMTPTAAPTAAPTAKPTATPTVTPTAAPTATPTATPTAAPTAASTVVFPRAAYSYEALQEDIAALQERYPSQFRLNTLQTLKSGRKVQEILLGNLTADQHVVVYAAADATDSLSSLLLVKQLEYYLETFTTGTFDQTAYEVLLQKTCIHIIPYANPDRMKLKQTEAEGTQSQEFKAIESLVRRLAPLAVVEYATPGNKLYWDYGQTGDFRTLCEDFSGYVRAVTNTSAAAGERTKSPFQKLTTETLGIPSVTLCFDNVDIMSDNEGWEQVRDTFAAILKFYY